MGFPLSRIPRVTRALALGATLWLGTAQAVELNGTYRWADGQTLVVKTNAGKVEGHLRTPGPCRLDIEQPVLKGEWEGNVLVGEVTLCEVGAGCGPAPYLFLGFFNAADGTLTADLELETSCELPALTHEGRLVLEPLPQDAEQEGSAATVAGTERRRLGVHTARGQKLLHEDDAAAAMREFQRALERREDATAAFHGMGLAQANQKKWVMAVKYYRRALQIRPDPFVFYNLACAQAQLQDKKGALSSLRSAVQYGFDSGKDLAEENDLLPLLGKDPEFRSIVAQLQAKAHAGSAP